jgi:hypothetical protein
MRSCYRQALVDRKGSLMSALDQKATCASQNVMSALAPKADMCGALAHVRFGPILLHKSVAEFFGQ